MLQKKSRRSTIYYKTATAHSILGYGKRGNAAYSVSCSKDRTSMINRMYQSSIQLELVSLNGYFGRVGQFQRLYRSSWSASTAISVELVSFNGYIGRVGQFQRIHRVFDRSPARSTERAAGKTSRATQRKSSYVLSIFLQHRALYATLVAK